MAKISIVGNTIAVVDPETLMVRSWIGVGSGLLFIPVRAAGGQAPLQARPRFRVRAVKAT